MVDLATRTSGTRSDSAAPVPAAAATGCRPRTREERAALLAPLLAQRILVIDGAMGTLIQSYQLDEAGFRGGSAKERRGRGRRHRFRDHPRDLRGNNDLLSLTQPGIVRAIHDAYLEAGADIIETNTFNATRIAQADYALEPFVREMNAAAARIAREAADAAEAARARPAAVRRRRPRADEPDRLDLARTSTTPPPGTSRSRSSPRPTRRPPRA